MQDIITFFPHLTDEQSNQFAALGELYMYWNERINVISRKDIENIYTHHILHSLSIAHFFPLEKNTTVLDVGTGGGFPGIPLAILFPEVSFTLIDATAKKISVVHSVAESLGLKNVTAEQVRVEKLRTQYNYIVSRAVTAFPKFVALTKKNILRHSPASVPNGIIYLKGGDFSEELASFKSYKVYSISEIFPHSFFETKKIIYLPIVS
ncbi:MAG: 16S rRNA (guanine(527)-N(7))-methyltransferase RsmG [Bacteroidales bacterium]|jgi:16S rRNA (guanine527-N7)-methyltransferase|nr:16S rRNA (guanine(527)-N(7))-methyltransferase RsmG [Bacteroidales bacterium]